MVWYGVAGRCTYGQKYSIIIKRHRKIRSTKTMKKKAFTLAEVLITLGIIGVIAAMTMPMINNKYRETKTVSKLTQTYSILQQAFQLAIKDESGPGSWNIIASSASGANNMAKPLISQMKLSQDCGTTSNPTIGQNCISNTKMKYLNGNQFNGNNWNLAREGNTYKVLLLNGVSLTFHPRSAACNLSSDTFVYCLDKSTSACTCGYILADIDGPNHGQNRLGWDVFQFFLTDHGIFPSGGNPKTQYVTGNDTEGWGATWWVLNKKNTAYQRCLSQLKIDGQSKCK